MKRSFLDPYMMNMYMAGLIVRKEEDNMAEVKTLNNDYIIKLNRQDARLWYTDASFKYLCKFSFLNDLNIEVFSFQVSENDIYIFLDNLYQYLEQNMNNIIFCISSYTVEFFRNEKVYNNSYMRISCNNIPRITIEFDEDILFKFIDLVYFCFLIDIDIRDHNKLV